MNTKTLQAAIVAGGLSVLLGLPASAQRTVGFADNRGWNMQVARASSPTLVSGDAANVIALTGPTGTVLTSLEFFERNNRPCRVVARFGSWSLDAASRYDDGDSETRESGAQNCTGDAASARVRASGDAISGIRVCQRAGNDRLKGVRVNTHKLLPTGLEETTGIPFTRPNCNEWQAEVNCDAGRVATAVEVHWREAEIIGLSLRCSSVTWQRQQARKVVRTTLPVLTTTGNTPGTAIGGLSASERVLEAPLENMALQKIVFGERNNRPCFLEAFFWTNNPTPTTRTARFDLCRGNHGDELTVEIPSNNSVVRVASSLVVCQRQVNDRLKGIRLLGSRLDGGGATPDPAITDEAFQANCNDNWDDPSFCVQGSVITALRVQFRPSENRPAEIVGLGQNCSVAEWR